MRKKHHGGGRQRNVSAKPELVVMLAPLSCTVEPSLLPQSKPLLPVTSHQVNQQAYAVVSHMR